MTRWRIPRRSLCWRRRRPSVPPDERVEHESADEWRRWSASMHRRYRGDQQLVGAGGGHQSRPTSVLSMSQRMNGAAGRPACIAGASARYAVAAAPPMPPAPPSPPLPPLPPVPPLAPRPPYAAVPVPGMPLPPPRQCLPHRRHRHYHRCRRFRHWRVVLPPPGRSVRSIAAAAPLEPARLICLDPANSVWACGVSGWCCRRPDGRCGRLPRRRPWNPRD